MGAAIPGGSPCGEGFGGVIRDARFEFQEGKLIAGRAEFENGTMGDSCGEKKREEDEEKLQSRHLCKGRCSAASRHSSLYTCRTESLNWKLLQAPACVLFVVSETPKDKLKELVETDVDNAWISLEIKGVDLYIK